LRWKLAQASARQGGMHLVIHTPQLQADDATRLDACIQQHGLGAHVHLLPGFPDEDRHHIFQACDALVLLPWHKSSTSDVLEIWSAGKPLIGDRFGGIGHFVRDGETGLLFDPESTTAAEKLAAHIECLAADETLRRQMGQQGHAAALPHDWSRIGAQLEEIYQLAEKHHQLARQQGRMAA
jgi:glycogen(starch) synthase